MEEVMSLAEQAVQQGATTRKSVALVELGLRATDAYGRSDLSERLKNTRRRLDDPAVRVLVIGEFKKGKSSLINALIETPLCPVDDDVATAVPAIVRFADMPRVTVTFEPDGAGEPPTRQVALEDIPTYASEAGNPANKRRVRSVEVGIPRTLLAEGLVLVDTPGVGGLGSVHSTITMAALPMADALIFVTDASQELSAPEFDFLLRARELCPNIAVVLTKVDFCSDWRKIMRIDAGRLDEAGLGIPVLPVSSTLRDLASQSGAPDLAVESGFPELIRYLKGVAAESEQIRARSAANDLLAVVNQLEEMFRAERQALDDPERIANIVNDLQTAKERADHLRSQAARWQVTLGDGIADLNADVDYDLRARTREIVRLAEESIDQSDPAKVWADFEPWLYRKVAFEIGENYALLASRTGELGEKVADHFRDAELELNISMQLVVPTTSSDRLGVSAHLDVPNVARSSAGLAALRGAYGGTMMFGMMSTLAGVTMMNPVSVVLGVFIGRKTMMEERERQLATRRQQAKAAVRRYVDEASFQIGNSSREALRRVQRKLRDEFEARANELQRTTTETLAVVQRAAQQDEESRRRRLRDVDAELVRIAGLRDQARALAPDLSESPD
jgi:Dynamin family